MILQFNCPSISGHPDATPLVFSWDPKAGTVTGPDAAQVLDLAKPGARLDAHPRPWSLSLGPGPLRSWRDMAVVVGTSWQVPAKRQALPTAVRRRLGRQGAGPRRECGRRGHFLAPPQP